MKKMLLAVTISSVVLGLQFSLLTASAQEIPGAQSAAVEESGHLLINGLEMINMVLAVVAIAIIALVVKQFGASVISVIFGYFLIGTVMLTCARLFILFSSLGYLTIDDVTVNLGWHLLFYLAMITFFIAGKGLTQLSSNTGVHQSFSKVVGWGVFCGVATLVIFGAAQQIDAPFVAAFKDSVWDSVGVLHFIAFILGGMAAFYLFKRAKVGEITRLLAIPYLVSFVLFALNHVWELFVASWKIIDVTGATGERVEQIFVLPAFSPIAYAYIRLWTLFRSKA